MPYDIVKKDGKFCVVKQGGEEMGCHESRENTTDQVAALNANEAKSSSDDKKEYVAPGVLSFSEYKAARDARKIAGEMYNLISALRWILSNIYNSDAEDKVGLIQRAVADFSEEIGRIADADDTDMKEASEAPEGEAKNTEDALGEESSSNEDAVTATGSIWLTKDVSSPSGWRWDAVWTNNLKDRDNPPDIISKKAHLDFIRKLKSGDAEMPELWHWHLPGSAWGKAQHVAYIPLDANPDIGFMFASGYVYKGCEVEAESMSKTKERIGVSHWMKGIVRSQTEPHVIESYESFEISDLPLGRAANLYTQFSL